MRSERLLSHFVLIVIVQFTLTTFAFSDSLTGHSAWSMQAERDAGKLINAGKVQQPARPGHRPLGGADFSRRLRSQVHNAAKDALKDSDRFRRRNRIRNQIRDDLKRSPGQLQQDLAIHPATDSDSADLQDGTGLAKTLSSSSISEPGLTESFTLRSVTRLSLDTRVSSLSGDTSVSSFSSSADTPTYPIDGADRLIRPIHGRPGIRPQPDDGDSTSTGTLPVDGGGNTSTDTRVGDDTRPNPNTSGGTTRSPDRRGTGR